MKQRIPSLDQFINEFGPMYNPLRGASNTSVHRVSYPIEKIKKGDTFTAIRSTDIWFKKNDKFEILDIKPADFGNSLMFYIKKNGKLNTLDEPFEVGQSEIELAIGK